MTGGRGPERCQQGVEQRDRGARVHSGALPEGLLPPGLRSRGQFLAAIVLDLGGLYALYLTGLYRAAENDDLIHAAVHLHMFLAGCLINWALIGLDPIRRRPGIKARLAALVVAGAAHDTLAKLMYAHSLPVGGGPLASRHTGAEMMYYGGTVIDIALAIVLMAQWYQASGRALARTARRGMPGHAHLISVRPMRNPHQSVSGKAGRSILPLTADRWQDQPGAELGNTDSALCFGRIRRRDGQVVTLSVVS